MDENKSIDQIEDVKELEEIQEKEPTELQEEKPVEEISLIKSGDGDEESGDSDEEPGDGDEEEQDEESTGTYAIVNRHVYNITDGANVDVCDIIADSKDNLPTGEDLIINRVGFGSFGYCITEREFYCLSSGGEWL